MRITFVISSLAMGGAERVLSLLADGLAGRGHRVSVLTFSPPGTAPYYALNPAVTVRNLDLAESSGSLAGAVAGNLARIRTLRRAIRDLRPDAVLPLMDATNVLTLLACIGTGVPVLPAEHIDPAQHDIGRLWDTLRNLTYPLARRVLLLTSGIEDYFPPKVRARCAVMPNPVVANCSGPTAFPVESPAILAMGRLDRQKGFDILIRAFAQVVKSHPDARVWVLGEGPERAALERLCDELGLTGQVLLPGRVDTPGAYLAKADAFVLSSRYEGFPLALCEALACGAPVAATKFSAGYGDILRHDENALVVEREDVDGLAAAMDRLLSNEGLRTRLSEAAPAILDRYGLDAVLDRWEILLAEVTAGGA